MAQKTNPNAFRLGITKGWSSQWFFKRKLRFFLEEDHLIRQRIKKRLVNAGLVDIGIERVGTATRVTIRSSRPGLIIGRGGKGIEELKNALLKDINTLRRKNSVTEDFTLNVNVEELKRTEISAAVVAQQIASIL